MAPKSIRLKIWIPVLFLFVLSLVLLSARFSFSRVCFGKACLRVELAKTKAQHERGLMYRKSMSEDRGMLFIFPESNFWSFWMKNTNIPLDIIWLDEDRKVIDMVKGARPVKIENPPSFTPVSQARYALEVNAGFAEKNNIEIGDEAVFRWIF